MSSTYNDRQYLFKRLLLINYVIIIIQEARRNNVKAQSKALTKAMQKPFSFDQRTKLRRSRSLSALDTEVKKRKENNVKFHARPMPHHIFE